MFLTQCCHGKLHFVAQIHLCVCVCACVRTRACVSDAFCVLGNYDLRINMEDFEGNERFAEYKSFKVDGEQVKLK